MVRECRPRERELSSLKLRRRSTMRTSVPASVSSAASIIPVGPPPAITTACSDICHASFPKVCQETLHHTRGLAAKPRGRFIPVPVKSGMHKMYRVKLFGEGRGYLEELLRV